MNKARKTAMALAGTAAAFSMVAAGCSSGGGDEEPSDSPSPMVSDDAFDEAMSTPTDLVFWTWVPGIEDQVAMFEEAYPAINVTVENVGQGGEHYTKVRTALESGEGAPDVVQLEYSFIPSFQITNSLLDMTPYLPAGIGDDYVEWVWSQVSGNGGIWAIPQDTGPLGYLYRHDIFEEAGVTEAPATFDEFAEVAQTVKDATGNYINTLPANEAQGTIGLFWQAGVTPWTYDGAETVSISVNSPEAQEVIQYWQDLVDADLVTTAAAWNDDWYQSFAQGDIAGWLTAAWAPIFLQGAVATTAGNWTAAEFPQWNEGENVSGNWGGSSDAVLATTQNPIAATELARWINYETEPTMKFATEQFLFPAAKSVLENPEFTDQEVEFFGGQQVNALFSEISATVDPSFQWLPFMDFVYSSYLETVGEAFGTGGDAVAALDDWQQQLLDYAGQQGFTVE